MARGVLELHPEFILGQIQCLGKAGLPNNPLFPWKYSACAFATNSLFKEDGDYGSEPQHRRRQGDVGRVRRLVFAVNASHQPDLVFVDDSGFKLGTSRIRGRCLVRVGAGP